MRNSSALKRVSSSILVVCSIGLTTSLSASGQDAPKVDPAMLKALSAYNSPQKVKDLIKESFHISSSSTWPSNFPVPAYTSNVVYSSFQNSTQGQPTAAAMLITRDQPRTVFDFYQAACARAGWKVRVPDPKMLEKMGPMGDIFILTADQGKQTLNLTCTRDRKTNGTVVGINWQIRAAAAR